MAQANIHSIKETKLELKKSLGQNFLTDQNIVKKIVNTANIDDNTTVIEIGPGIGALTEILLQQANNVIAVEIDQRLIPILNQKFNMENFMIINEDFLKIENELLIKNITGTKTKVVANLPYYITTAIITKILLDMPFVDEIYIMVQKEVAERITASPKTKKYNSLSVFCQTISEVNYEFTVKRTVFNPVPNVDSAIISFKRIDVDIDIYEFEKFVQNCFKQKRKTLVNNIATAYNIKKDDIIEFLIEENLLATARSEEIANKEFKDLFNKFKIRYSEYM